jgi:exopolysaccharide biosynthesis polyprenyl glycosylphosphotransferase
MLRRFSSNFAVFSIFLDILLVDVCLLLSATSRPLFNSMPFLRQIVEIISLPWILYIVFPFIWVGVLMVFSVYDGRKNLRLVNEFGSLTLGTVLAAVAMAGVLYLSYRDVSRFLYLFFVGMGYFSLLAWRGGMRLVFRWRMLRGVRNRRVLILGAGSIGRRLEIQFTQQPELGLTLVGFLDDDHKKQADHKDVLGGIDLARVAVLRLKISDVVIALPLSAHHQLLKVVSDLHDLPVQVWVIPDYFSLSLHRASVEEFGGMTMLDLRAPALNEYQRMTKRAFDLVVVALSLPVVLPLTGLIALLIKVDDKGPVFYNPQRVGENGHLFRMFKFRTMVVDAEELQRLVEKEDDKGRLVHKHRDDPRVTRVGHFLRKTSLDELPQVYNVLKGEMSLVGPRPEMPYLVEKYEPWQRKRFAVPQGLTGWWQVNGRSDKPMHLHTEDDIYYVQHYSLWKDIEILIRTVGVVFRGKGAF